MSRALRRLAARSTVAFDELRLRVAPPKTRVAFVIVTAAHNVEQFVRRHLDSIWGQDYPKHDYRHVIYDDASSDATSDLIQLFIGDSPDCNIEHVRNEQRIGGCANLTRGFRSAPKGSVVLQVDGDDWLPDPQVLSYLNLLYQDQDLWMTYNSWVFPDGRPPINCWPIPSRVIERASYRDEPWNSSHLHSFRSQLFAHVRDESLIDPDTHDFFSSAVDMAHYFPMLELSGKHARHVERPLYVYNLHPESLENRAREKQLACEERIRSLERYSPLLALD
jgi:glycosyltransferase involved in cell wall biosynthesis